MVQILLIGVGAGTAAALLFASIASGSALSMLLAQLAPLPILIAALGWSPWAGLTAALSAAAGLGLILGFQLIPAFLIGIGLPAWWLGYLALLARPSANGAASGLEWYPVGRLVLWAALIGAVMVVVSLVSSFGTDKDTFESGLRGFFEQAIRLQGREPTDAASRQETKRAVEIMMAAAPPLAALHATLFNAVNLWLAGRIVNLSGRLRRPWPDVAALRLPSFTPILLAGAVAGTFLPDLAGVLAWAFAAGLAMAYAILGFAVLHAITRETASRPILLSATYAAVIFFAGVPILAASLLGLAETAFNIRDRVAARRGSPGLRT